MMCEKFIKKKALEKHFLLIQKGKFYLTKQTTGSPKKILDMAVGG